MKKLFTLTVCFFAATLINLATVQDDQAVMVKCIPSCSFLIQSGGDVNISTYNAYGQRLDQQLNLKQISDGGQFIMNSGNPLAPGILIMKSSPK